MNIHDGSVDFPWPKELPDGLARLREKIEAYRQKGNTDMALALEQVVSEAEAGEKVKWLPQFPLP